MNGGISGCKADKGCSPRAIPGAHKPMAEKYWDASGSITMIGQLLAGRMFLLTIAGLDSAMRELSR